MQDAIQIAALSNHKGILKSLGKVRKELLHLLSALQILLFGISMRPARVSQNIPFGNAAPNFMSVEVILFQKLNRMGRNQGQSHFYRQVGHQRNQQFIALKPWSLHLKVKPSGESPIQVAGKLSCLFSFLSHKMSLNDALGAAGQTDQPLAGLFRKPGHANFSAPQILVIHPGPAQEFAKRKIALMVLAIDSEPIGAIPFVLFFVLNPEITANNGLESRGDCM